MLQLTTTNMSVEYELHEDDASHVLTLQYIVPLGKELTVFGDAAAESDDITLEKSEVFESWNSSWTVSPSGSMPEVHSSVVVVELVSGSSTSVGADGPLFVIFIVLEEDELQQSALHVLALHVCDPIERFL